MRVRLLVLLAVLVFAAPASAQDRLDVRSAVLHPDAGTVGLAIRCIRGCSGPLHVNLENMVPITDIRTRRLPAHRFVHVTLPLLPSYEHSLNGNGPHFVIAARLGVAGGELSGTAPLAIRPSCRSGATVARSEQLRAFRLPGVGVYACERPDGRPVLLSPESDDYFSTGVARVVLAGRYAAAVIRSGYRCSSMSVSVTDVHARRRVRARAVSTKEPMSPHGCFSSGDVAALVLRPSGAVAFSETPGADGVAVIRASARSGDRVLASGPDVDPGSLHAIDATTIGWLDAGVTRTARLR